MRHQRHFNIIFFVVYFIILVNAAPSQKISRGVNTVREFPYLVAILETGGYICGGSIIDNLTILTAAHCVDTNILISNLIWKLTIVSGSDKLFEGGTLHKVCSGKIYPGYVRNRVGSKPNDIAVLTLCEPIIFNKNQNEINLPDRDFVDNTTAIVAGWTYTDEREKNFSFTIQKFTPKIIHSNFCKPYADYKLYKGHLCAQHQSMLSPCRGMSGSPLVANNKIIGIVSWGPPHCSTGDPEVYTNVLEYVEYINLVRNNLIFE